MTMIRTLAVVCAVVATATARITTSRSQPVITLDHTGAAESAAPSVDEASMYRFNAENVGPLDAAAHRKRRAATSCLDQKETLGKCTACPKAKAGDAEMAGPNCDQLNYCAYNWKTQSCAAEAAKEDKATAYDGSKAEPGRCCKVCEMSGVTYHLNWNTFSNTQSRGNAKTPLQLWQYCGVESSPRKNKWPSDWGWAVGELQLPFAAKQTDGPPKYTPNEDDYPKRKLDY